MEHPPVLSRFGAEVDAALFAVLDRCGAPQTLMDAMKHSVLGGGKRLRPALVLACRDLFPPGPPDPLPAACAVELVHAASLVHDDLPAMDDDELRRGRPTCHKVFGEAVALLAGDAMLALAFDVLGDAYLETRHDAWPEVVAELAAAAGPSGLAGGQVLDAEASSREMGLDEVELMHSKKTGALVVACVRAGAVLGGASKAEKAALSEYGRLLGLAFQVRDDVLDAVSDAGTLGKSTGKDAEAGKTTFVDLMGVDGAAAHCRHLADQAARALEPFGDSARDLADLARFAAEREY